MGHVATNIGGVVQTPKTYDQSGVVYTFVPKENQQRAMQFLERHALTPPTWLINEEVLGRIENVGTVERMRTAQVGVVNRILDPGRMQRLIEGEARLGRTAYSLGEMLGDLRTGVWSELGNGRSINVYRRNLQRGYLERMEYLMTQSPSVPSAFSSFVTRVNVPQSDIRPFVRGQLETLKREIQRALGRNLDLTTRLHLQDAVVRIDRILDPNG
jgi:hypothetical protein